MSVTRKPPKKQIPELSHCQKQHSPDILKRFIQKGQKDAKNENEAPKPEKILRLRCSSKND